jgi:hypothetical protein
MPANNTSDARDESIPEGREDVLAVVEDLERAYGLVLPVTVVAVIWNIFRQVRDAVARRPAESASMEKILSDLRRGCARRERERMDEEWRFARAVAQY